VGGRIIWLLCELPPIHLPGSDKQGYCGRKPREQQRQEQKQEGVREPVRVQLQKGSWTPASKPLIVLEDNEGVTVAQVVEALTELRASPFIPKSQQPNADKAYLAAVAWTLKRPPHGVGPSKHSFPFDKKDSKNDWRFDIDILVGQHLKE
jgi:hypothetical protein